MKRIHRLAVVAALFLLPAAALADPHEEAKEAKKPGFARRGFYVGVNAAYGFGNFYENAIEADVPFSINVNNAAGLNARVGYRILSFLAVEAHYEWMNDFQLKVAGLDILDQTTHTVTGNLKLLLPLWRFQPYLLLGAGGQYYDINDKLTGLFDDSQWVFAARPALGVDLYITRNVVFNVEGAGVIALSDLSGQLSGVETLPYVSISAGLQWRF